MRTFRHKTRSVKPTAWVAFPTGSVSDWQKKIAVSSQKRKPCDQCNHRVFDGTPVDAKYKRESIAGWAFVGGEG